MECVFYGDSCFYYFCNTFRYKSSRLINRVIYNDEPVWELIKIEIGDKKVFYINGTHHAVESTTRIEYPIFIGIVPKWRSGNTINYSYLQSLVAGDKLNNNFYCYSNKIAHSYNFSDPSLKEILVAMPIKYPELQQMITPSQHVGPEAFSIIDVIPFQIPGAPKDVLYKLYIYDQALVRLNSPVTFTFES